MDGSEAAAVDGACLCSILLPLVLTTGVGRSLTVGIPEVLGVKIVGFFFATILFDDALMGGKSVSRGLSNILGC
uniref:Putative secreted peptide n=1 Tax=Anopheles braziliensis TaxID=58242 RepID=A0A2M3ZVE8_9DIPT